MSGLGTFLSDLISELVLTSAHVSDVHPVAPRFTKVRLQGRVFQRSKWTPGDKLQLRVTPGSVDLRTYTPTNWSQDDGSIDLIGYGHGNGPGADWFGKVSAGTHCEVFGPSRSIDLSDCSDDVVFVGDETSVPLAVALKALHRRSLFIFETHDSAVLQAALHALDVTDDVDIVPKSDNRNDLFDLVRGRAETCSAPPDIVVSGDAATVHSVRRATSRWPDLKPRIKARAYWSRGRTGLS